MTDPTGPTAPVGARRTALLPASTRVVELGEVVSTAVCGRFLQRLGAQVTRVLPTGVESELANVGPHVGQGSRARSALAEWLHDGKTLAELDLQLEAGRAQLDDLLSEADVVVIAGTTVEWADRGVSLEHIRQAAPTAVIGQITRWGDSGPHEQLRGGELQLQAMGGLMNLIGVREREPVRLGGHPMQAAAGLLALDGVMIGLFQRQNSGTGSRFTTSEFESVAHVEWKIASAVQSGRRRELRGEEGGGPVVARTNDGHFALFFIPRNWDDVKAIIRDPRLDDERFATDTGREKHQAELATIVEDTTRSLSKKDLYYRAQQLGIPAGHVATMNDLLTSPQYRARDFFTTIDVPGVGLGKIPDAPWQVLTIKDVQHRTDAA